MQKSKSKSTKSEYLNSKQILISQIPKFQIHWFRTPGFWIWDLFRISDFGFRIFRVVLPFFILVFGFWISPFAQESKEEEALFVAKKAFADGFYEVSLGLLERFLKNYPDAKKKPEADLLIGQCYFHQNRFLDALKQFEELLNQPEAKTIKDAVLYWIAEVHFKGNDFSKATQFYQRILDEFPQSSYVTASFYSLGWCLFQEGNYNGALRYFKIVEEKFPHEPQAKDATFKIIECLYNLKDYPQLKEKLKSCLKLYAKDSAQVAYIYFYLAEAEYYLDNFSEAIEAYKEAITLTADDKVKALSKLGMGWSYLKSNQYPEAENRFGEVILQDLDQRSQGIFLLGKALLMSQTNRFTEAKNLYQQLLNLSGDAGILVQSYLGYAEALYNLGQYQEAANIYKKALKETPKESLSSEIMDKLHYGLSWVYLKEGEFKLAIEEFQKIAKLTEDKIVKVSALCQIGDAYQDAGDFEKAIQTYDSILKDYPDSFYNDYVQYQLGLALLKVSNYEAAIMSFLNLKRNFPKSKLLDDASYALGLAYFQREDYNTSREIFSDFVKEFKESQLKPQALYLLGTSLYNLGKFNEAIEVFKEIIRKFGYDTDLVQKAEYEIADCYYQKGEENEAMARFKILRAKYPDSSLTPEVIWWLGEYYYRRADFDLARRYFSSLIQDFPKSNLVPHCYYAEALTYQEQSKYPEAIDNFKQVIALGKSELAAQAGIAIADIYVKEENFDLALAVYKEVIREYKNLDHLVYPKAADLYARLGNYEEALDFYRRSLEVVPVREVADIQFKIAQTFQAQGKIQEAIEEYLKVTYLYCEDNILAVKSLLRVAAIYEDKEDFKEAANIYKRIMAMDVPEAKYAQERIDWIKTYVK